MSNDSSSYDVVLYAPPGGKAEIEVRLEQETVWLAQAQIADLFGVNRRTVNEHLVGIYREGELEQGATCRNFRQVRQEGARRVARTIPQYNLDAILSVGYRVNSRLGTQFRIWATRTLKERLIQDHNRRKHLETQRLLEMQQAVALASRTLINKELVTEEGRAVLEVITDYARSWSLLLQYDEKRLPEEPARPTKRMARLTLSQAQKAIARLKTTLMEKGEASDLFSQDRGQGLAAILGNIEQTFAGKPLYPSVESRAANLLYFVIKDHPFADGNKRIGSFLFLCYLDRNKRLKRADGSLRFDNNALVALALLIAESDPKQRDLMVRVVLGLLDDPQAA